MFWVFSSRKQGNKYVQNVLLAPYGTKLVKNKEHKPPLSIQKNS
jgi:hypothetical protein